MGVWLDGKGGGRAGTRTASNYNELSHVALSSLSWLSWSERMREK